MPLVPDRHGRIIRLLRLHGSVDVTQLARQLGVSAMTIRRDLAALAGQGILDRVHGGAVLRSPTKRPERRPSELAGLRFAVLLPALSYYFGAVLRGAEEMAAELGVQLIYVEHGYEADVESRMLERIGALDVDGLVVSTSDSPTNLDEQVIRGLARLSAPMVLCERPEVHGAFAGHDHVASDHGYGVILALRHLAANGHRRITWASRSSIDVSRQSAVDWAEQSLDLEINDLGGVHPGVWSEHAEARRSIIESVRSHASTALIVHSDFEALDLLPALCEAGIEVPTDLSVISTDDERVGSAHIPVTSISPPKAEVGRRAVALLHRRVVDAGGLAPVEHVWLLPRLVVRESTGPVRARQRAASVDAAR